MSSVGPQPGGGGGAGGPGAGAGPGAPPGGGGGETKIAENPLFVSWVDSAWIPVLNQVVIAQFKYLFS